MQQYSLAYLDKQYNKLIIDLQNARSNLRQEQNDTTIRYINDIEYAIKRI